ncbi:hypothetical protein [Treponema denticola]|uniref:hypothetical protein n=1 Tax=Treponema denticola TaxID=158 RepID=UPI00210757CC|nr:hypothetical protein [Treponema denticola]
MRKRLFLIIGILFIIFAGCKQFLDDIEKDFKYWSSRVFVTDTIIPSTEQDSNGYPCLTSDADKTITIKLTNPQNYVIQTPEDSGAPSDIVRFGSGTIGSGPGAAPEYDTDYTLTRNGPKELKLTLKEVFLKKNEWGRYDLNPEITIYSKEGRKFLTHSFKLRVNTSPPNLEQIALLKTNGNPSYYVLCLKGENINTIINGSQFLHGDGNDESDNKLKILIRKGNAPQPTPYSLTFGALDFSHDNNFVGSNSLSTLDGSPISSEVSDAWVIRYKTDIKVDTGAAVNYTIRLADRKGLQSDQITSGTQLPHPTIKLNSIGNPTNYINTGIYSTGSNIITDINKTNSSSANPIQIYTAYKDEIKLEAFGNYGSGVEIKAKLNNSPVSDPSQISLTASEGGTVYTLELWAAGGGFPQSKKQTYHYKVFNTIKAQHSAVPVWGILKTAVTKRNTIKIDGIIKATDADSNKGQILIIKDVNIVGKNNANLDANNKNRIFYVKRNALKLENIKLSNGYAETGGAIYGDNSAHTYLKKVTIQSNTATTGKDIYLLGNSSLYMEDEIKLDSNNQIYIQRIGFNYAKFYLKEPNINKPIKIEYYDIDFFKNKEVITNDDNYTLTEEDIGKFNLLNSEFVINLKHEDNKAVLSKIHQPAINTWNDLKIAINDAESGDTIKLNQSIITAGSSPTAPLKVTKNLTIIGTDSYTTLNADNKHRVFEMDESNIKLTLKNLIIKNGKITNGYGAGISVFDSCQNSILTLVNTSVEYNTIKITDSVGTYCGAGIMIPNQNVKVFIIGGSISYNKIDCTGSNSSPNCIPQGCGLWLGIGSTTIIKGKTEIKNNSYTKAANSNITTTCYGVGIYIKGASTLTIGEADADDNISPEISGHRKVAGTECHGTAIAIEEFNSYGPTVNWNSGQITGNHSSQATVVYNRGGTFIKHPSNHNTAD